MALAGSERTRITGITARAYAIPTDKVMEDAKTVENDRYAFSEYISDEAKQYLTERYGYKEFLPKPAAPAAAIPGKA